VLPLGKLVVPTQYLDDESASACAEIADAVDYFDACVRDTQRRLIADFINGIDPKRTLPSSSNIPV
jgi:hypothetical protein